MAETRFTFCHICEQCCGLAVSVDHGRVIEIQPDRAHPYNWRDFCVKGARAAETIYHPLRIKTPMRKVDDRYEPATYEEAISDIATRLQRIRERYGGDAIAAYSGNPQSFSFESATFLSGFLKGLPTHNYYFAASVDTNALHVVAEQMYGSPWLALNVDVDACRCFLLIGTNPAESAHGWVGHAADGWKRMLAAKAAGADLIVVDPRRSPTASKATLHVAIRPGEDWAFLLGLIHVIFREDWLHTEDLARTTGLHALRGLAAGVRLNALSQRCDVPVSTIEEVARRFATAPSAHCVTRTGSGQSRNGTLAEWLGQVLNVITGRIERPGGRTFNPGVFDHIGAVERMFRPSTTPSRVRGLPPVAGAHSLAELPDEIETPGPGQIRALIMHGGNPVISGPDGPRLDRALSKLDLLVSIDLFQRESHRHAHWLIPAVHFLERTELHPLLASFHDRPFVQMGRAVVDPPSGVRPDWQFLAELALEMRVPLFGKPWFNAMIRGSRALARLTGRDALAFKPAWLTRLMLRMGGKVTWSEVAAHPHGLMYEDKRYGAFWGALRTADRKIHLCPPRLAEELRKCLSTPLCRAPTQFPLQLISRRRLQNMNSWLTDTTGLDARPLLADVVEIARADADALGVADGDAVQVVSRIARLPAKALVSDRIRPGVVVFEHGWGSGLFDPSGQRTVLRTGVNRNALVSGDELDPLSQVPLLNGTPVRIERSGKATVAHPSNPPQR
ncbi:molybdopterin-containing oxidoreductase family protein [Sinimarinibacterium thermocellulolyticum]|uniref:Molybdopterin-dependent oxidoreductase n=1 Tax=Sinimarinibacterium thermocellulolyticum TaxID=3170016 RepID=A0ABV2ADQ3_9GAMM